MKNYLILNVLLFGLGCNQSTTKTTISAKEESYCNRIVEIADAYNPYERKLWLPYNKETNRTYPLDDSLNIICKKLNPDSLQKDIHCRNAFVFLCEKYYLSVYRASNGKRNDFSVYNAHIWNVDLYWLNYALNILTNTKLRTNQSIASYGETTSDWVFVEYIIAEGERNKDRISNDNFLKVHDSCIAIYPKVRDSLMLYLPLKHNLN